MMSEADAGEGITGGVRPDAAEESFAELFRQSEGGPVRFEPGQKVKGKVVSISADLVYVDLGRKSEGVIDLKEFVAPDGELTVRAGSEIEAFFVTVEDGVQRLTTTIHGYSAGSLHAVRDAHEAGLPVSGEVRREVKGGYEVSAGGVRCFCPHSQMDLRGGRDASAYVGKTFPFRVLEFAEEGRNIVLSRRVVLEEERTRQIERLKETLEVGAEITGTIRAVQSFGAFVDIGGIDGFIPASEVSWDRTESVSAALIPGRQVTAKILSIDWDKDRLTLSLRALQPDPWQDVAERYPAGSKVTGTIARLVPFGAFVTLDPGVDGLIHISNLGTGRKILHPKEVVGQGQQVEAYVLSVDAAQRRISLSLQPKTEPKKIPLPEPGQAFNCVVDKVMPFGLFVKMSSGLAGLIPNAEVGTAQGTDHKRMFAPGTAVRAVVTEVDSSSGRIRLSRKAAVEKEDREEYEEYVESSRQGKSPSGGLTSLGELLRAKIEGQKKPGKEEG